MSKKKRRLIVIGKVRAFDEEIWKRLLVAYAYYLHEQRSDRECSGANDHQSGGGA